MHEMGVTMEQEWRKGPWTPLEDKLLIEYISHNGEGRWSSVSKCTGLNRSGKSCRLRWVNYLRPGLKKGHLSPQEEGIIIELHAIWGNKWSTIARYLPGRTDNEIKNYWRTHFKKSKPCDQMKQENKRKMFKQQKQQGLFMETDHDEHSKINDVVANESVDEKNSKRFEAEIEFLNMDNEHDQVIPLINQETASDIVPFDCYLWGGLWPTIYDDDHVPIGCSKGEFIDQTKTSIDYFCSIQGDHAVDYVNNGGFIF